MDDLKIIDQLCDEFESAKRQDAPVTIESLLEKAPESARRELFRELVSLEIEYNDDEGDYSQFQLEYTNRFPGFQDVLADVLANHEGKSTAAIETPSTGYADIDKDLGRYQIIEQIGEGAMGSVYAAMDTTLQRKVALKFPKFSTNSREALYRFYTEARAAAAIRHPNICPIYDVGEIKCQYYISMALIEGDPLSVVAKNTGPFSEKEIARLIVRIAAALQTAHQHGVVHRDLKPANIMIDNQGEPIIMDFGLAQRETEEPRITKTGAVMGTPSYMSPEQVIGTNVGPPTDIYSLGVIVYELISGQVPFEGSIGKILVDILELRPPDLQKLNDQISPRFEEICSMMLSKRVSDRYASMEVVAETFQEFLDTIDEPGGKSRQRPPVVDTLAILPLTNVGGDDELDYLSDGITETLINTMSRIEHLRVMACSTVFQFKGKAIDPIEIGKQLNVRAVLTGRVQHRSKQLVVKTELVSSLDGTQLWGDRFIRDLEDFRNGGRDRQRDCPRTENSLITIAATGTFSS